MQNAGFAVFPSGAAASCCLQSFGFVRHESTACFLLSLVALRKNNQNETMKSVLQSIAILTIMNCLIGCTAYVDPGVSTPSSVTTTTTTADPYAPASVTTQRTTTIRR
jgi:hypothetical protein